MANSEAQTGRGVSSGSKDKNKFQPEQHLQPVGDSQYLPLKWRLVWLRAEHPHAQITTRLVRQENDTVLFRALIKLPDGAVATGWGAAKVTGANLAYYTQAEDMALLRALLALGYGVEYASELDVREQPAATLAPASRTNGATAPVETPQNGAAKYDEEAEPAVAVAMPEPARPSARVVLETPAVQEYAVEEEDEAESEPEPAPPPRPTPAPTTVPRRTAPVAAAVAEPAPAVANPPVIGNATVEERIKMVTDERLRLFMKEIYYEARSRFSLSEDKVDERSVKRYGVPVYELDEEEAEEFLERIRTSRSRESR